MNVVIAGVVHPYSISFLKEIAKTIGYIMPPEQSIDIDNEFDFLLAEFILKNVK